MKNIKIHRTKYFAASIHVYDVIIASDSGEERKLALKNGESIIFELDDNDYSLSIWYHSFSNKTRFQIGNTYFVKASDTDKDLVFDQVGRGFKAMMALMDRSTRQLY